MGYAVRTATHRYVEWRELPGGAVAARELYDHTADPGETRNRVDDPAAAGVARELGAEVARIVAAGGAFAADTAR
jgi:iduronate 2-sulfatase